MINKLFTYGTLMCPEIIQRVSGHVLRGRVAELEGYQRFTVRNENYPAITARSDKKTSGILYDQVTHHIWQRLDAFEGEPYWRKAIKVKLLETAEPALVDAYTYVFKVEYAHLLSSDPWNYEYFLNHGKNRFLDEYIGFDVID